MTNRLVSGQITVTTAGTAVQGADVSSFDTLPHISYCGFYISALSTNAGSVYVGNDGAGDVTSSNGYELPPGDKIHVPNDNLNELYFDAATNGDKVSWLIG